MYKTPENLNFIDPFSAVAGQNVWAGGGQHGRVKPKGSGGKTPENF